VADYSRVSFKNDGRIMLLSIVGTRPEIIRLSATIKRCREYFDCCVAHTGQNYDKELNDIFWSDFDLGGPDVYLNVVGENFGQTCGNIIARSYKLAVDRISPSVYRAAQCGYFRKGSSLYRTA